MDPSSLAETELPLLVKEKPLAKAGGLNVNVDDTTVDVDDPSTDDRTEAVLLLLLSSSLAFIMSVNNDVISSNPNDNFFSKSRSLRRHRYVSDEVPISA